MLEYLVYSRSARQKMNMPGGPNCYYGHPPDCACEDYEFVVPRSRNLLKAPVQEIPSRAQQPVIDQKFFERAVDKTRRLGK